MRGFAVWGLILLIVVALISAPTTSQAQTTNQPSLAYVNGTGNVFVTTPGSGPGTAVTQDADFNLSNASAATHLYTHVRWSADGSKLAFEDAITRNLYVYAPASGQPYQSIASNVAVEYPPAWLPDSSAVAYVMNTQQSSGANSATMNIQQVLPAGGQAQTVGAFTETVGCGGGTGDPAQTLDMHETALNGNLMTFAWTKGGWLYSPNCNGVGIALNNFNNQQQWQVANIGRIAVGPGNNQGVGVFFDTNNKPTSLGLLDLATGQNKMVATASGVDQVGWSADGKQVLFSTVDGQTASLWKMPAQGGQPALLFSDQGRYIGVLTSSSDSQTAVFSFIPGGDNPQTQVLSTPLNGATTNRTTATTITEGGQPAFATVTVASQVAAAVTGCTPRADWTNTYTVLPGDTLGSVARRTGATIAALVAGNCLTNANLINIGQVLRVPVMVQPVPVQTGYGRRIQFPPGATSVAVQGQAAANVLDTWVLTILAGQTLTAQLNFSAGQGVLIIWGANGVVLQSSTAGASGFVGVLPTTQDYFLAVQTTTGASYNLTINVPPLAVRPPNARRIQFATGATSATVLGQLAINGLDTWVLGASAGQTLTAQLAFSAGQGVLIVWGADGTVLLSDHAGASAFNGVLPKTQDYYIAVRGNPTSVTNYSLAVTVPPLAVAPPTTRRIVFPAGATSVYVQGQLAPSGSDYWILKVQAGQTMTAQLTFSTGQAIIIVYGADGNVFQSDHAGSSSFSGVLPTTQDYHLDIRNNPDTSTSYTLVITVPPLH